MRIRLSHSTMELLFLCERKFQLVRLLEGERSQGTNPNFCFGHSYEAGCTTYFMTGDKDKAIFDAYLAYHGIEEEGHIAIPEDKKKNEWTAVNMVISSFQELDNLRDEWEIAVFDGKPAAQLSFKIEIDEVFYYVGYLDLALRNRYTGRHAVLDFKTTGMSLTVLDPLYMNSGQLVGYSVILDAIVGKDLVEYDVQYFVGQLVSLDGFTSKIKPLTFQKSLSDRLNFFITLGMDVNRIKSMMEMGIFPQRGSGCLKYNRPCPEFGTCGLHALDVPKKEEPDTVKYQFVFQLEDLIKDHIERI